MKNKEKIDDVVKNEDEEVVMSFADISEEEIDFLMEETVEAEEE